MKTRIYVDLDDTIVDFAGPFNGSLNEFTVHKMYEPGFFLNLKPLPGALSGVRALIRLGHDVHILTQPVAESALSYTEKAAWVAQYLPELVTKVHMTQDKGIYSAPGHWLIDDNANKWEEKFEKNGGKFFLFAPGVGWNQVVQFFVSENGK